MHQNEVLREFFPPVVHFDHLQTKKWVPPSFLESKEKKRYIRGYVYVLLFFKQDFDCLNYEKKKGKTEMKHDILLTDIHPIKCLFFKCRFTSHFRYRILL